MTHIGRYEAAAGAYHTQKKLLAAREQLEFSFTDDGRRAIPEVAKLFAAIDHAMGAAKILESIFAGSGTHTLTDFFPDATGVAPNTRQMMDRANRFGLY